MTVKDIMRSPVVTVIHDASIREAVAILRTAGVSGLPILDRDGKMIGIVTEHDIIKAMLPTHQDIVNADAPPLTSRLMENRVYEVRDNPIDSIMTRNVVSLNEGDSILKAASTMILKKVKRLPVIREGRPVGIISRIDIVQAIMEGNI